MGKQKKWEKNTAAYAAYLSLLSAFAIILSYVEILLPIPAGVYGMKLGLANFVVLLCIYEAGIKEAVIINGIRILTIGFLFGNLFSILFSLSGALCSLLSMSLLKKTNLFGMVGVSVAGGVSHNLGQLAVAATVAGSVHVIYFFPILMVGGVITGIGIGILAQIIDNRMKRSHYL